MRKHAVLAVLIVAFVGLTGTANSQLIETDDQLDTEVFRRMKPGEIEDLKTTGGLVIGEYVLSDSALRSIRKSPELADAVRRIETVAWNKSPYDKQNADLTIRQRMDDYLDTAIAFYDGKGNRNGRQIGLTDIEIGDRQLSSALQSVKLAHVWGVPLDPAHVKKLAMAIRKRHEVGLAPPK